MGDFADFGINDRNQIFEDHLYEFRKEYADAGVQTIQIPLVDKQN